MKKTRGYSETYAGCRMNVEFNCPGATPSSQAVAAYVPLLAGLTLLLSALGGFGLWQQLASQLHRHRRAMPI